MHDIQRSTFHTRGLVSNGLGEIFHGGRKISLEGIYGFDGSQETLTNRGNSGCHIRILEGERASHGTILFLHRQVEDAMSPVDTTNVDFDSSTADSRGVIREEISQKIHSSRKSGTARECDKIGGWVRKLAAEFIHTAGERGDLGGTDNRVGSESNFTVSLFLQFRQRLEGLHELIGKSIFSKTITKSLNLTKHGQDKSRAHTKLLVGLVFGNNDVKIFGVGLGKVTHDIVLELASKQVFDAQEFVQSFNDNSLGLFRSFDAFKGSLGNGFGVGSETSQNVLDGLHGSHFQVGFRNVESTFERANLLDLGRVTEFKATKQVTGRNDGTRRQAVGNLSTFRGLQGHDHFHGFHFDVGLTSFHITSVVL